jgi:hypothetical protein
MVRLAWQGRNALRPYNFVVTGTTLVPFVVAVLLLLMTVATPMYAQDVDVCTPRIQGALAGTQTRCLELPERGICYGNSPANILFSREVDNASFATPGDVIGLSLVDTLELGAFDPELSEFGIARANIRLNFTDDTLTAWLFGGMQLANQGDVAANVPAIPLRVTSVQGANVRALPDAEAELVSVVLSGADVRATGRLRDNSWVRVQTDDGIGGWVVSGVFGGVDLEALVAVDDGAAPQFGSMQAFLLNTNPYDRSTCRNQPPPGVLIQSPEDTQTARLRVNDLLVDIAPMSTVHLSAGVGETLRVDVMEGEALVTADNPITIEAGNGLLLRDGVDADPAPYDYNALAQLPVERLPRPIYLALDFSTIIRPALQDVDPLAGLGAESTCTIAAVADAANLREFPAPDARVRRVLQFGESARPDGRAQGSDNVLWWRLAEDVWVSSNAVGALGDCGTLPVLPPR